MWTDCDWQIWCFLLQHGPYMWGLAAMMLLCWVMCPTYVPIFWSICIAYVYLEEPLNPKRQRGKQTAVVLVCNLEWDKHLALLEDLWVDGEAGGQHQVKKLPLVWVELVLSDQPEVFYPAHSWHVAGVDHRQWKCITDHHASHHLW